MATPGAAVRGRSGLRLARDLARGAAAHRLPTHASAIAFRILVALVPLALLGAGLLGALGLTDVWDDSVYPQLEQRLTAAASLAANDAAQRIFARGGAWLLVLAAGLVLWNSIVAVSAVRAALNEIHDTDEERPALRRLLVTGGLAVAIDLLLVGALLTVVVGGRVGESGALHVAATVGRWPLCVVLLWAAVALLVRFAPSEQPSAGWASIGSASVVGGWLVASLAFGAWSASVADYTSAVGQLTWFLGLTAYVLALAAILLAGVELDEALRTRRDR